MSDKSKDLMIEAKIEGDKFFQEALELLEDENKEEAEKYLKKAVAANLAGVYGYAEILYKKGYKKEAAEYYKVSECVSFDSEYKYAKMLYYGDGIEKNRGEAVKRYRNIIDNNIFKSPEFNKLRSEVTKEFADILLRDCRDQLCNIKILNYYFKYLKIAAEIDHIDSINELAVLSLVALLNDKKFELTETEKKSYLSQLVNIDYDETTDDLLDTGNSKSLENSFYAKLLKNGNEFILGKEEREKYINTAEIKTGNTYSFIYYLLNGKLLMEEEKKKNIHNVYNELINKYEHKNIKFNDLEERLEKLKEIKKSISNKNIDKEAKIKYIEKMDSLDIDILRIRLLQHKENEEELSRKSKFINNIYNLIINKEENNKNTEKENLNSILEKLDLISKYFDDKKQKQTNSNPNL